MTFSIVARSADGESWGVAVASKFLAVGSAVPAAAAGIGAVASQAWCNVAWKPMGLSFLAAGASAGEALQQLLESDEGRDHRQAGIVDADGNAATHTGPSCLDWAGGAIGAGYAIQGNILTGPEVVDEMESAWLASDPDAPLALRLMAALAAGDAAGGDSRGRQSAAILVVRDGAGYDGGDDVAVDLRIDDHPDPINELGRLLDLHDLYLTATAEDDRIVVDEALLAELEDFATGQGAPGFGAWVGTENFEMRVADDLAWIDPRILSIVRTTTSTTTGTGTGTGTGEARA